MTELFFVVCCGRWLPRSLVYTDFAAPAIVFLRTRHLPRLHLQHAQRPCTSSSDSRLPNAGNYTRRGSAHLTAFTTLDSSRLTTAFCASHSPTTHFRGPFSIRPTITWPLKPALAIRDSLPFCISPSTLQLLVPHCVVGGDSVRANFGVAHRNGTRVWSISGDTS